MKITDRKTMWEGKFMRMVILEYEDRNGQTRQWEVAERTTSEGVVIIAAITTDLKLLLIRQYRPALDSYVIELPAGLIEKGESPSLASGRELIEETGFASESVLPLSEGVISTGVLAENWHVMLALGARPAGTEELAACPPDETEDIEVIPLALDGAIDALLDMEARGARVDVRIFGIVELARRKLKAMEA